MTSNNSFKNCWICGCKKIYKIKNTDINIDSLDTEDFQITNSQYGKTLDLYKCKNCNFIQAAKASNLTKYYEKMVDEEYEETRKERFLQEDYIIKKFIYYNKSGKKLLDVGCGSGILLEASKKYKFQSIGVEPSKWLYKKAIKRGLDVRCGVLEDIPNSQKFDVITLADVIEHVTNPMDILEQIKSRLKPEGIGVIVTPNVDSLLAKILRWKWWHYRVAHVGYFSKKTIKLALEESGFQLLSIKNTRWFFSLDYLVKRISTYLPKFLRISKAPFIGKKLIKLNLGDSIIVIFKKS